MNDEAQYLKLHEAIVKKSYKTNGGTNLSALDTISHLMGLRPNQETSWNMIADPYQWNHHIMRRIVSPHE